MLIHCNSILRHILGGFKVFLGERLRKRIDVADATSDARQDAKAQKE